MLSRILIPFLVLSLALSACGAISAAQAFSKVGNDFMTHLKDGNYEPAFSLFHPQLQAEVGDAAALEKMIEDNAAQPKDWSFSSMNTTTNADKVTIATLEGSVNFQDGKTGTVKLEMVQDAEVWKILSFNLSW